MARHITISTLSGLTLLILWATIAFFLQSRYVPTPPQVLHAFQSELFSGALFFHLGATLLRVVGAFLLAISIGTVIGIALGRNENTNRFFDTWLVLALNIPALVTIVFCYLWIGLNETAAIIAVALNKIPMTAITMREGARALIPAFDDLATIFGYSGLKKFKHFTWPQLEPFMASTIRNGLALIWKIVLIVEVIGRSNGVGFQINLFFGQFDLARILVYALSFMLIIWLIEAFLIKPWEWRSRVWRGELK